MLTRSSGYALTVADLNVLLYPVSFVVQGRAPRLVALSAEDGSPLSRQADGDVDSVADSLLRDTISELEGTALAEAPDSSREELLRLSGRYLEFAGAERSGGGVQMVFTSTLPVPLAEAELDITNNSPYSWRTINMSQGRRDKHDVPEHRSGSDAVVLEFWRQAMEETDVALDFLPPYLSLHQLRSLYDAVWGYAQDPSGFKRWAIDRRGAFNELLVEVQDAESVDREFYESLGRRLPPDRAARAGALAAGGLAAAALAPGLGIPLALAAAVSVNKLFPHRGPEPTWFRKSDNWRPGPSWIENVYPPRPGWTRWDTSAS